MNLYTRISMMMMCGLLYTSGYSQEFSDIIKGSVKDANYLAEGYFSPVLKSFGASLNQGWYNTAKPHKRFGFDLTVSVMGIRVPSSDKLFTVDNTKLETLVLTHDHRGFDVDADGSGAIPTLFGNPQTKSRFDYKSPLPPSSFNGVGGAEFFDKFPFMPMAIYNFSMSFFNHTDLKFRFFPKTNFNLDGNRGEVMLWGVGVLHDVKHYMPGIKMLPIDLSVFTGHTRFTVAMELDGPEKTGDFVVSSTTVQALASKKIGVLTLYGGAGYDFAGTTIRANGYYDLNGQSGDGPDGTDEEAKDPVNLKATFSGPRATAGFRLKFAVITLHADYTLQKYSAFTAGFGINVR